MVWRKAGDLQNLDRQHEAWLSQLSFSVTPILQYIHRMIGEYTTHGVDHSENIERLCREIVEKCNAKTRKCNTSSYEEYLLLASAWLHDIGNIWGRDDHNLNSCKIIDLLGPKYLWGLDPNSIELIKWICFTHSSHDPIKEVPETIKVKGSVKLLFLSALFRLMDTSDIANRRAPLIVYELIKDKIDEDTDRHWTSHQAVADIFFPDDDDAVVITVTDETKAKFAINRFGEKFGSVREILLHYEFPWKEFRICKIDKVPI